MTPYAPTNPTVDTAAQIAILGAEIVAFTPKPRLEVADAESVVALTQWAHVLTRIAIDECNGIERFDPKLGRRMASWHDVDQKRADSARERATAEVQSIVARLFGAVDAVTIQNDPRGAPIQITAHGRTFYIDGGYQ